MVTDVHQNLPMSSNELCFNNTLNGNLLLTAYWKEDTIGCMSRNNKQKAHVPLPQENQLFITKRETWILVNGQDFSVLDLSASSVTKCGSYLASIQLASKVASQSEWYNSHETQGGKVHLHWQGTVALSLNWHSMLKRLQACLSWLWMLQALSYATEATYKGYGAWQDTICYGYFWRSCWGDCQLNLNLKKANANSEGYCCAVITWTVVGLVTDFKINELQCVCMYDVIWPCTDS